MPDEVLQRGEVESGMTSVREWVTFDPKAEKRIVELLQGCGFTVHVDKEFYEKLNDP